MSKCDDCGNKYYSARSFSDPSLALWALKKPRTHHHVL
jgi:hypothetical protein